MNKPLNHLATALFLPMRRSLISLFSAGWIFPMWLAANTYLDFMENEMWPRLAGGHPINSFPYLRFCQQALTFGCVWLAFVILYWAWRLSRNEKGIP